MKLNIEIKGRTVNDLIESLEDMIDNLGKCGGKSCTMDGKSYSAKLDAEGGEAIFDVILPTSGETFSYNQKEIEAALRAIREKGLSEMTFDTYCKIDDAEKILGGLVEKAELSNEDILHFGAADHADVVLGSCGIEKFVVSVTGSNNKEEWFRVVSDKAIKTYDQEQLSRKLSPYIDSIKDGDVVSIVDDEDGALWNLIHGNRDMVLAFD